MTREWKPGDVAMVTDGAGTDYVAMLVSSRNAMLAVVAPTFGTGSSEPLGWSPNKARPLVVIDPEDREQVERLAVGYRSQPDWHTGYKRDSTDAMQAALREFADPTPPVYTTHGGGLAPWPVVGECHSSHREGHECPQCAWEHEHEWVAWPAAPPQVMSGPGIPIRCTKCGGRKCDADDCALMRHTHQHGEGVTP